MGGVGERFSWGGISLGLALDPAGEWIAELRVCFESDGVLNVCSGKSKNGDEESESPNQTGRR